MFHYVKPRSVFLNFTVQYFTKVLLNLGLKSFVIRADIFYFLFQLIPKMYEIYDKGLI